VLIIDEAQNLHTDVLEQIRLLTNLETSQDKLLQIILIGQPELLSILKRRELRQLSQRITARYHLLPLSRRETYGYIRHRLLVAGRSDPIFTSAAMSEVYRLSRGVPRLINVICDRSLLGAYARDKQRIGAGIVRRATRETRGITPRFRRFRTASAIGLAALVALAMIGIAAFFIRGNGFAFRKQAAAVIPVEIHSREPGNRPGEARSMLEDKEAGGAETGGAPAAATVLPGGTAATEAAKGPAAGKNEQRPAQTAPRLADILAASTLRGTSLNSFANLYERLGIKVSLEQSKLGCEAGRDQGYECLFRVGNWNRVRYFDLPAILELALPTGQRHLVTLVRLGNDAATLAIKDREYTFPLAEIDEFWDGSFIIVWQPPFATRLVSPGARGREVLWIRQAVDTLEGKPRNSEAPDLYDEALRRRIIAFQRDRSLPQDGRVGNATLVRLANALKGPAAPSLTRHAP
jgi:general secretion pathway protein A